MSSLPLYLLPFLLLPLLSPSKISNLLPRLDSTGLPMDIHDGNILSPPTFPYQYYFYGMGYGHCQNPSWGCMGVFGLSDCGFQLNHSVSLYVSNDLSSWTFQGDVLPYASRPEGIYFRPKVIYDPLRSRFVLWVNRVKLLLGLPNYLDSDLLVAVSPNPEGPFTVVTEKANVQHGNPGDFTLFIDDDGQGYLIYDSFNTNHKVAIEKLDSDYLDIAQDSPSLIVSDMNNEAPIFFKRQGVYYLLYGQCCCFCVTGSNSQLKTASSPMGPYTDPQIDIDPFSGSFFGGKSVTGGQESFVFTVRERNRNEDTYVFVSDRWASALDGQKGHDLQYWGRLEFTESGIKQLSWVDEWELDL